MILPMRTPVSPMCVPSGMLIANRIPICTNGAHTSQKRPYAAPKSQDALQLCVKSNRTDRRQTIIVGSWYWRPSQQVIKSLEI